MSNKNETLPTAPGIVACGAAMADHWANYDECVSQLSQAKCSKGMTKKDWEEHVKVIPRWNKGSKEEVQEYRRGKNQSWLC